MSTHINLKHYEKLKNNLIEIINELILTSDKVQKSGSYDHLKKVIEKLNNEKFMVTVVGEFSRGKSTFINALIGANLLPSKVVPTTAFINQLFYETEPKYYLKKRFSDQLEQLGPEDFREFVAPREVGEEDQEELINFEERLNLLKQIEKACIGYPSLLLKNAIEIYDTPGTNDIYDEREQITYNFIPNSDAVIFLLSATAPCSESEIEFLQNYIIAEHIKKIFFVVNFKDRLKPGEESKVLNYIEDKLNPIIKKPKIFLVSSLEALQIRRLANGELIRIRKQKYLTIEETGFADLEKDLAYFLEYEKGAAKVSKHLAKVILETESLHDNVLPLRISAFDMKLEEVNQALKELNPKIDHFRKFSTQIVRSLKQQLLSAEVELQQTLKKEMRVARETTSTAILDYAGKLDQKEIQRYIKNKLNNVSQQIKSNIEKDMKKIISQHLTVALGRLDTEKKLLDKEVKNSFQISVSNSNMFSLSELRDETDALIIGAVFGGIGIGIGVIATAPILLLGGVGIAVLGVFNADKVSSMIDTISQLYRSNLLSKVANKVEKQFYQNQDESLLNFSTKWKELIRDIELKLIEEVNHKTLELEQSIAEIRIEKEGTKLNIQEKKQFYIDIQNRLRLIHNELRTMEKDVSIPTSFLEKV